MPPKQPKPPKPKPGTMLEVWEGKAPQTRAGLTKDDLMLSPKGKVKSKLAHEKAEIKKRQKQRDKCDAFYEAQHKRMPPYEVGELVRYEIKNNHPDSEKMIGTVWEVMDKNSGGYQLRRIGEGKPRGMEITRGEARLFRRV